MRRKPTSPNSSENALGDEVVAHNGELPVERSRGHAGLFGTMGGEIELAPDFDDLPDDIAEAFGAG